jgi:hypothetical protein
VAIWSFTNNLILSRATVPDRELRERSIELAKLGNEATTPGTSVPLQPSTFEVDIFVRDTGPSEITLAVTLRLDPNTRFDDPKDIDLYLDGLRVPIKTGHSTTINVDDKNNYTVAAPTLNERPNYQTADVTMTRNTKVVDVEAILINMNITPGLPLISPDGGPPLLTAESGIYSFRTTSRLDPATYTGPSALIEEAGTRVLTLLPPPWTWFFLILALYLLPRVGRALDALFKALFAKFKRRYHSADDAPREEESSDKADRNERATGSARPTQRAEGNRTLTRTLEAGDEAPEHLGDEKQAQGPDTGQQPQRSPGTSNPGRPE